MAKERKTPGSVKIAADVLAELNAGTRSSANLTEGLAVDFSELMRAAFPEVADDHRRQLVDGKPSTPNGWRSAAGFCWRLLD
ncbi:hypothetical protein [Zavarzinella formosa]|uniref:hypothetical protein n=1 Tax=Zavarzinella formosa TaxID=360055 RepID=UPI0002DCB402|nr:hypothetical protein [Zavarzinella formosa]